MVGSANHGPTSTGRAVVLNTGGPREASALRCSALLCSAPAVLAGLRACYHHTRAFSSCAIQSTPQCSPCRRRDAPVDLLLPGLLPTSLSLSPSLPLPLSPIPAAACLSCTTLGIDPRHSSLQSRSLPWYHELGAHTLDLNLDLNLNCILDQRPTPNEQHPRQALQEQQYCITWRCVARPRRNFQLGTMEPHSFV
jgi:hypothetical protein